eukprot:2579571-Prymnesium_polylepis.1
MPATLLEAWEAVLANDTPHYREALRKAVQVRAAAPRPRPARTHLHARSLTFAGDDRHAQEGLAPRRPGAGKSRADPQLAAHSAVVGPARRAAWTEPHPARPTLCSAASRTHAPLVSFALGLTPARAAPHIRPFSRLRMLWPRRGRSWCRSWWPRHRMPSGARRRPSLPALALAPTIGDHRPPKTESGARRVPRERLSFSWGPTRCAARAARTPRNHPIDVIARAQPPRSTRRVG